MVIMNISVMMKMMIMIVMMIVISLNVSDSYFWYDRVTI